MNLFNNILIFGHGKTQKVDAVTKIDKGGNFLKLTLISSNSDIEYAIFDVERDFITGFIFKEIYENSLYNNKVIVRTKEDHFLSGILDLTKLKKSDENYYDSYLIPPVFFKIYFWEDIGYLFVFSPNDCMLVDFDLNPLLGDRHYNKIEMLNSNIFWVTKGIEEFEVKI